MSPNGMASRGPRRTRHERAWSLPRSSHCCTGLDEFVCVIMIIMVVTMVITLVITMVKMMIIMTVMLS